MQEVNWWLSRRAPIGRKSPAATVPSGPPASHDAANRIALAALGPGLGEADQVPQATGCFNVLDCDPSTDGDMRWDVVRINQVPPEVAEPTAATALDDER